MISLKLILQFIVFINYFNLYKQENEFFNCLENSAFSSDRHCSSLINKWDRLPTKIKPIRYKLTIQPIIHVSNESDFHFRGTVSIECQSAHAHSHVLLHAGDNLVFKQAKINVYHYLESPIKVKSILYVRSRKWLLIKFKNQIPANDKYYIIIRGYKSIFSKKANGLYFFSYTINKVKKYGTNALLSPFYARNMFPCFDDPIFETPIQFNVIHKEIYLSQSITEVIKTRSLGNGWFVDVYRWTPYMQVYQFTFSVNTFQYISKFTSTGHLMRLWAPESKLKECKFSMEKILTSLEFYENYFNSTYVFNKLDIVVTTKMPPYETGSSTYGVLILMDSIVYIADEKTLPRMKQIYVNTINHEIAHQWIGNTLKIEWFDALWVVEGLVGYMEQKMKTHQTQYNHRLATALTQTLTGLYADDSEINHKLSIYPYTAKHVEYYFDDLIFTKGFSMFKMIEGVIGEENFQFAIRKIINNRDLKPMKANDMWNYIDKVLAKKDLPISIEFLMRNWQTKIGFPIVHATITRNNILHVHQVGNFDNNRHVVWPVPITFFIKNGEERSDYKSVEWLYDTSKNIPLRNQVADDDWFVINHEQIGFYRVNYDLSNWILLIHQLRSNHTLIPPIARLQMFDDIFEFYCNGEIPGSNTIFDVLSYLEHENEFTIWKYSRVVIDVINTFFETRSSYKYFKLFLNKLIDNLLHKIRWTQTNHLTLTIQMRDKLILTFACRFENPYCQQRTEEYFDNWMKDYIFIVPLYLYGPMMCHGVKYGDRVVWVKVLKTLANSKMSYDQKLLIAQSLSCSRDEVVLESYWSMMLTNSTKYKNLYQPLLSSLARNIYSRPVFLRRICTPTVNLTKNAFEFAATLAALNNFMLPEDCVALAQLKALRFKRSSGDNLEIESSLITQETRHLLLRHLPSLERWLKTNMNYS